MRRARDHLALAGLRQGQVLGVRRAQLLTAAYTGNRLRPTRKGWRFASRAGGPIGRGATVHVERSRLVGTESMPQEEQASAAREKTSFQASTLAAVVNLSSNAGRARSRWRAPCRPPVGRQDWQTWPSLPVAPSRPRSPCKAHLGGDVSGIRRRAWPVGRTASHVPPTAPGAHACHYLTGYRSKSPRKTPPVPSCDGGGHQMEHACWPR